MGVKNIFKLLEMKQDSNSDTYGLSVGINLKVSEIDINCPLIPVCYTERELIKEVKSIYEDLERIMEVAKGRLNKIGSGYKVAISPDMQPSEIWGALEKIQDEELFIEQFNLLEEDMREAVAEHVLTQCNVFFGKGALFSTRYNQDTKFIE